MTSRSRWTGYRQVVHRFSVRKCRLDAKVAGRLSARRYPVLVRTSLASSAGPSLVRFSCVLAYLELVPDPLRQRTWMQRFYWRCLLSWFTHVTRFMEVQGLGRYFYKVHDDDYQVVLTRFHPVVQYGCWVSVGPRCVGD